MRPVAETREVRGSVPAPMKDAVGIAFLPSISTFARSVPSRSRNFLSHCPTILLHWIYPSLTPPNFPRNLFTCSYGLHRISGSVRNQRLDDVVLFSLHHMKGAFHLRKREPVRCQRGGIDPAVLNEPQQAGHPLPATRAQGRAYLFIAHPQTKC